MTREKRKNTGSVILLSVLNIILICAVLCLGFLCYFSFQNNATLKQSRQRLQKENEEMSEKIVRLQAETDKLQQQVTEFQNAQAAQERQQQEENGMLTPPEGDTVLSGDVLESLAVGQVIDEFSVIGSEEQYFKAYEITEGDAVYNRINGKSYYPNNDIGLSDLRYLKLVHYNFEHQVQVGELIVNAAICEDVLNVFRELFDIEYEIQSMRLIDDYWTGDGISSDSNSIDNNNTSAFCYRLATGGQKLSNHALGRAIDINPQQSPYVWYGEDGTPQWSHENASSYVDRTTGDAHVIVESDACYNIFKKYGFSWGGLWQNPVDYQHFEKPAG